MSSIPIDWTRTKLGNVAKDMFGGGTPSTKNPSFWQGNIPWLTSKSLGDSIYLTAGEKSISEEAVRKSATHIVPAGNLIFATRVGVGKVVVTKINVAISQDGTGIVVDPTEVDPTFLAYQLRTDSVQRFVEQNKRGATIQGITRTSLQQVDVVIPPPSEQRRIAHVLITVHTAIEQQARLIELTRELQSALMMKLFTEGLRGEKQKETEVGFVPAGWEVICIGNVGEVVTGRTPSTKHSDYYGGEYRLISPADLDSGKYVHTAHRTLTKEGFNQCRGLPKETVLVGCIGNVGKIGMTDDDKSATNQQINSIISSEFYNPHFVYYCLQYNRKRLENIAAKVTVPIVNKSNFENFKVASPGRKQQDEIANALSVLDDKVEILERKKQILEELFRTLLHQLMTGQVRVKDLEI